MPSGLPVLQDCYIQQPGEKSAAPIFVYGCRPCDMSMLAQTYRHVA